MKSGVLDSLPWRVAERLVGVVRRARARARGGRALPAQWAVVDRTTEAGRVQALRIALRGGGYETAATLAETLRECPPARSLVAETLYVMGERERAAALAPGRPEQADLARRAERHPMSLLAQPQLHLALFSAAWPGEPERAMESLNRFLRAQGLPRARMARRGANILADLEFERPRTVEGGPLVSVLMAARDAAGTVAYAVDSILSQSHRNLELLVCDDASTDGTGALLKERYGRDPRVRLFASRGRGQGTYNIRNALVPEARGELVTFQDADDVSLPGRVQIQLGRLAAGAAVSLVGSVRVSAEGRFVFFHGGSAIRPAMISLMTRREHCLGYRQARFGADFEMREALRARHGDVAVDTQRAPHVFMLSSAGSLTRAAGSESLDDGYRSPARRAYAEAVFQRYVTGGMTDGDVESVLRKTDNWIEPAGVDPL